MPLIRSRNFQYCAIPRNPCTATPKCVVKKTRAGSITRFLASLAIPLAKYAFSQSDTVPQAGQQASEFTLPSQDGTQISLKDFRGKWVVLYFYPKDNTPGCTIEAHNFQRDLPKYEQDNAVIVGVSVDSPDSHKDFCAKQGLTFKLLADTDKKVVGEYGSLRDNGMAARNT